MAIIALIFGSVLGTLAGLLGWTLFGLSVGSVLALYLGTSLSFVVLPRIPCLLRSVMRRGAPQV
ncbi:hypothetical protein KUH32_05845 [Thalassococcus sp. CAU 1522]|uniref:Major facilitator superfamily (MFS) profile domain-containing protein n=1 Tax=Thalassococcus arenae TaxID=2851652 RepID=A0ABS6N5K3_9RHOB|nr:hypothetical protein [Thalassococcus arenae]MBV2359285.1 hypothetical protein [Thalassococcus arenae]